MPSPATKNAQDRHPGRITSVAQEDETVNHQVVLQCLYQALGNFIIGMKESGRWYEIHVSGADHLGARSPDRKPSHRGPGPPASGPAPTSRRT